MSLTNELRLISDDDRIQRADELWQYSLHALMRIVVTAVDVWIKTVLYISYTYWSVLDGVTASKFASPHVEIEPITTVPRQASDSEAVGISSTVSLRPVHAGCGGTCYKKPLISRTGATKRTQLT